MRQGVFGSKSHLEYEMQLKIKVPIKVLEQLNNFVICSRTCTKIGAIAEYPGPAITCVGVF